MEIVLALILFIGLIVSWLMLPGSTTGQPVAAAETTERSPSTATQPA
ncbi:MAG: hypothetical protein JOZ51_11440 [Chloroflexi bacterium]|nr:hypothetical protein [Chloroflexota bacterium]